MEHCLQMFILQGALVVQLQVLPQGPLYMQALKTAAQQQSAMLESQKIFRAHSLILTMIDIATLIDTILVYPILLVSCLLLIPIKVHVDYTVIMLLISAMENVKEYLHTMNLLQPILRELNHLVLIGKTAPQVHNHQGFLSLDTMVAIFLILDLLTTSTQHTLRESLTHRLTNGRLDLADFEPLKAQ